jgi:hypothetical protein
MPALVTATVLRWRVDVIGQQPVVTLAGQHPVELIVGDGTTNTDFSPIIAEYIRTAQAADRDGLLADARDGLLQVARYQSTPVTPPQVPLTRRAQALADAQAQGLAAIRDALAPPAKPAP